MRVALLALAALLAAPAAAAPDPGSKVSRDYVQETIHSDTFELMEAQSALAASSNPQVRAYAQAMIAAHRASSAQLLQAAAASGLRPPPPHLGNDQAQMLAALQSERGFRFDQVYAKQQALGHRAALAVQQGYAARGDEAALRRNAQAAAAMTAQHLAAAEQLRAGVGSD